MTQVHCALPVAGNQCLKTLSYKICIETQAMLS